MRQLFGLMSHQTHVSKLFYGTFIFRDSMFKRPGEMPNDQVAVNATVWTLSTEKERMDQKR